MLLMFTMVSNVFQVFLQVFQMHVSFVFRRMLQLLHLDVSKLDRVLHLSPRLFAASPQCQAWEDGGNPHWHGQAPRACRRVQQTRRGRVGAGRRTGGSGAGVQPSGASHSLF